MFPPSERELETFPRQISNSCCPQRLLRAEAVKSQLRQLYRLCMLDESRRETRCGARPVRRCLDVAMIIVGASNQMAGAERPNNFDELLLTACSPPGVSLKLFDG